MALPLHYHWRHLFVRRTPTILTLLVVAAVVGTFAWVLGFYFALRGSLAMASDPHTLVVTQRGAISETNSSVSPEEFNRLAQLGGVATDAKSGQPLISPEMYWQTQLPRIRDGGKTRANVALRGVTERAFQVHPTVRITRGRVFSTGAPEIIVGESVAKQFAGVGLGERIRLGFGENREYEVVGLFSADRGPLESEIWAYLPSLQSAYQRNSYSSAIIRLTAGADAQALKEQITGPAIQLSAVTESEYWAAQAGNVRVYQIVCFVLIGMMALAAVFAVANTMFATVAGRTREIAMLRTIGYSGRQLLTGFVIESVLLTLIGGVVGCAGCLAYLTLVGGTKDMFGANSFTTLAFDIRLTPTIVLISLVGVGLIGALGAWFPARRAARMGVIAALRTE